MKSDADSAMSKTVGEVLRDGYRQVPDQHSSVVEALLGYVLGIDQRARLLAYPERTLAPDEQAQFDALLARLQAGEPLPYLTGHQEFHGLSFSVTPDVLIPRPETEEMVDGILAWLAQRSLEAPRIVDVGTGSGAIAVTLAVRLPNAPITAAELSPTALDVARQNAVTHQVHDRMKFVEADLLDGVDGTFDVIVANLPYIDAPTLSGLDVLRWEPALALEGGPDGLALIRRLLDQAPDQLASGGLLTLEIGHDQGQAVLTLCQDAFPDASCNLYHDLAGHYRWIAVEVP